LNFSDVEGLAGVTDIDVFWPDDQRCLSDYRAALDDALDSPLGANRLERYVGSGSTVSIIVDDPSRWTPVSAALPLVTRRLHASGVKPQDVTVTFGVGRHQPVSAEAMSHRLGRQITDHYRCFSPPLDELSAYVDLGYTPENIPVRIFRPVAEAKLRILVGSVLPHLQAGFGGGLKLIFPGTSHRSTLGALHRQGLERGSDPSGLIGGNAAENPMRRAIHALAERLGQCWSISHLTGSAHQVLQIASGDPVTVQDLLATEARRRFEAPAADPVDIVVAGNNPWPGDPMQSFKVLLHHQTACREGGVLVGLFWTDTAELDRSMPVDLLRLIASSGRFGARAIRGLLPVSEWFAAAVRSNAGFMLRWARELVLDRSVLVYAPVLHNRFGSRLGPVRLFADQASLWQAAVAALHPANRPASPIRIRIFPRGGLTYVAANARRNQ
jgi:hypothetical protein